MAAMPEETKKKISVAVKRALESPSVRARYRSGARRRWTPEYRKDFGRRMREAWRERRAREASGS